MKNLVIIIAGIVAAAAIGYFTFLNPVIPRLLKSEIVSPISNKQRQQEGSLAKYSFPRLKQTSFSASDITLGDQLDLGTNPTATQFFFSDSFAPNKQISGTIMIPDTPGEYPIILLLRGWADEEIYTPGYGTKSAAEYFTQNGYITIAPDYLGYADSDPYSEDFAEARFQTYTTTLTLLNSLQNISDELSNHTIDVENVGLWGHSNGGQVALATLAITGQDIPTTLWAPVSIAFPDNILHYASEQDDGGALIQDLVQTFKRSYDHRKFSPTNYFQWIEADIQLHQGGQDDAVPQEWSDTFEETMLALGKNIAYHVYSDADHNMKPDWQAVIDRDVKFFDQHLK